MLDACNEKLSSSNKAETISISVYPHRPKKIIIVIRQYMDIFCIHFQNLLSLKSSWKNWNLWFQIEITFYDDFFFVLGKQNGLLKKYLYQKQSLEFCIYFILHPRKISFFFENILRFLLYVFFAWYLPFLTIVIFLAIAICN
jgi:hypothetical protein